MMLWNNTGVSVELGELVDNGVDIWSFDYPVPRAQIEYNGKVCLVDFNKAEFEQKVIDHYRFRQIGQETPARFLHYFKSKMREIMPYYVQLYEFDAKFRNIDDPLESYNLVETFKEKVKNNGTLNGTNVSATNGTNIFSDTPQGTIANIDMYMSNASKLSNTNTGDSTQVHDNVSDVDRTLTRKGNIGVQPLGGEVENIRGAFINIDMMIIEELNDLFLKIY